jgi:FkbM family methyltransferase
MGAAMAEAPIPFLGRGVPLDVRTRYGVDVAVEDDLRSIMSFVLLEREAWFEDEVAFLQRALPKGAHIVDVGANVGVYAAALAHAAGPHGRVAAVEPHPVAGALLERNAVAARQAPIHAERRAVAASAGRQSFRFGASSELSGLVAEGGDIEVETVALDALIDDLGWQRLDFLKFDVEGAEDAALAGAPRTLGAADPVVMLEVNNSGVFDFTPMATLAAHGYAPYRLVPGLGMLAPLPKSRDLVTLNAFAVKPTRAAALEAQGFLSIRVPDAADAQAVPQAEIDAGFLAYIEALAPFGQNAALARRWRAAFANPAARDYLAGCADLVAARNRVFAPAVRAGLLERAQEKLIAAARERPSPARATSLLSCMLALGNQAAVRSMGQSLLDAATGPADFTPDEPVVVPFPRFETLWQESNAAAWLKAIVLTFCIEKYYMTTKFMPDATLQLAAEIAGLGYASAASERRRQLCAMVLGRQAGPVASPLLNAADDDFLNRELWRQAIAERR